MKPHTVNLDLLYLALKVYWFQKLDIFIFGDTLTAQGDGLFVFSAQMPRKIVYPVIVDSVLALEAVLAGEWHMEYSDASKREHLHPHDWLSSFGYDISSRDVGSVAGKKPASVFEHDRPGMGIGMIFEDTQSQLGILMSPIVLTVAQTLPPNPRSA